MTRPHSGKKTWPNTRRNFSNMLYNPRLCRSSEPDRFSFPCMEPSWVDLIIKKTGSYAHVAYHGLNWLTGELTIRFKDNLHNSHSTLNAQMINPGRFYGQVGARPRRPPCWWEVTASWGPSFSVGDKLGKTNAPAEPRVGLGSEVRCHGISQSLFLLS